MAFPATRYFAPSEFKHPERMNPAFVLWLDNVRARARVAMVITDDARDPGELPSGASKTSLHFRGCAVDVRSRNWSAYDKWRVVEAIVFYADSAPGKIELELVYDQDGDKHWHIGVDETALTHQLIEADD